MPASHPQSKLTICLGLGGQELLNINLCSTQLLQIICSFQEIMASLVEFCAVALLFRWEVIPSHQ